MHSWQDAGEVLDAAAALELHHNGVMRRLVKKPEGSPVAGRWHENIIGTHPFLSQPSAGAARAANPLEFWRFPQD
jgi:hypothetical protein